MKTLAQGTLTRPPLQPQKPSGAPEPGKRRAKHGCAPRQTRYTPHMPPAPPPRPRFGKPGFPGIRIAFSLGAILLGSAGPALARAAPAPLETSAAAAAESPGPWPDARPLLQQPDFVRTADGATSIVARRVAFCGHVHRGTNQWRFVAADAKELAAGRRMLESALAKYPRTLLETHLDSIHLVHALAGLGTDAPPSVAGTYGERTTYVLAPPAGNMDPTARFPEAVFHHELSSVLVAHHPGKFDAQAWKAANPPDFEYRHGRRLSPNLATNYLPDGFVCSYGRASMEDDINTFAMWLFTRADWLLEQAARQSRVERKVDVLIRFYHQLDARYTREFFLRHCSTVLADADRDRLDAFAQAIAQDPADPRPLEKRACLQNNLGLYPEAIRDAEAALALDPLSAYAHYVRGWARNRVGRPEEAIADHSRAIELVPGMRPAYQDRAFSYEWLGKAAEARQDLETARKLRSKAPAAPDAVPGDVGD